MNSPIFRIFILIAAGIVFGKIYSVYIIQNNADLSGYRNNKQSQNSFSKFGKKGSEGVFFSFIECFKKNYLKNDLKNTIKFRRRIITVFIKGAVKNPGKYRLPQGARMEDLVRKAGGYTDKAWNQQKNFYLKAGMKIWIPRQMKVEIKGEVNNPGVYLVKQGRRLYDLIEMAGGVTSLGIAPKINYYLKENQSFFIFKRRKKKENLNE
jgi:DNA uptake protein ComE-like DNA-binding protein